MNLFTHQNPAPHAAAPAHMGAAQTFQFTPEGLRPIVDQPTPQAEERPIWFQRESDDAVSVYIDYINHRGERAVRYVRPLKLYWGSSQWHSKFQYLLHAVDVEKNEFRTFAMSSVHRWSDEPFEVTP